MDFAAVLALLIAGAFIARNVEQSQEKPKPKPTSEKKLAEALEEYLKGLSQDQKSVNDSRL